VTARLAALALLLTAGGAAAAPPDPPGAGGQDLPAFAAVVDLPGALDPSSREAVRRVLDATKAETGLQLAVLLVPSLDGLDPARLAERVYRHWRLGSRAADDGLLLMVSVAEPWWTLQPGVALRARADLRGMGGSVDDALSPLRAGQPLGPALVGAVTAMARAVGASEAAVAEPYELRRSWGLVAKVFAGLLIFAVVVAFLVWLEPSGASTDRGGGWPG
jgi:uncharacterized protein